MAGEKLGHRRGKVPFQHAPTSNLDISQATSRANLSNLSAHGKQGIKNLRFCATIYRE